MANFGAQDVPALLAELGVDVVLGAQTVKGLVDREDHPLLDQMGMAGVIGRSVVVTVQTGTLASLAVGAAMTVDGESFLVASTRVIEDGELTQIIAAKS